MSKPLRQQMPIVAAFIDQMRAAFGPEEINAAIRAGMEGQPVFYARENGHEVGTRRQPVVRDRRGCDTCAHFAKPGLSAGYCAGRTDLPSPTGNDYQLRLLPADKGASCAAWLDWWAIEDRQA